MEQGDSMSITLDAKIDDFLNDVVTASKGTMPIVWDYPDLGDRLKEIIKETVKEMIE